MISEFLPAISSQPTLKLHFAAASANGAWCRGTNARRHRRLHAVQMCDASSEASGGSTWACMPIADGWFARAVLDDFNKPGANDVEIRTRPHLPGGRP